MQCRPGCGTRVSPGGGRHIALTFYAGDFCIAETCFPPLKVPSNSRGMVQGSLVDRDSKLSILDDVKRAGTPGWPAPYPSSGRGAPFLRLVHADVRHREGPQRRAGAAASQGGRRGLTGPAVRAVPARPRHGHEARRTALRWAAVDVERGSLVVERSLQRVDGTLTLVRPKTLSSVRTIPPARIVRALTKHGERQAQEGAAAGGTWTEASLVFTSRGGTPAEPDNLRRSRRDPPRARARTPLSSPVPLLCDCAVGPGRPAARRSADRGAQRHRGDDEGPRARVIGRAAEGAGDARGPAELTPLAYALAQQPETARSSGLDRAVLAVQRWWLGPGSNRRPSAFQADARTN